MSRTVTLRSRPVSLGFELLKSGTWHWDRIQTPPITFHSSVVSLSDLGTLQVRHRFHMHACIRLAMSPIPSVRRVDHQRDGF